jgi:2,4-dienoyl-CoA reductase-like NADH-dependent reductase (Old Yellow Enzyme family)
VVKPAADAQRVIAAISEWINEVPFTEGYNVASAKAIQKVVGNAKLAVCDGLRRFARLEGVVKDGIVQLVSLSRLFLRQPDLVNVLKMEVRDANCVFCGLCQQAPRDAADPHKPKRPSFNCEFSACWINEKMSQKACDGRFKQVIQKRINYD